MLKEKHDFMKIKISGLQKGIDWFEIDVVKVAVPSVKCHYR